VVWTGTPPCGGVRRRASWPLKYRRARQGVANRDLKLENMLLDRDGQDGTRPLLKICDFGYSKHEMNSSAKTGVGTPIYMAPEIIHGGNRYDAKVRARNACLRHSLARPGARMLHKAQARGYLGSRPCNRPPARPRLGLTLRPHLVASPCRLCRRRTCGAWA